MRVKTSLLARWILCLSLTCSARLTAEPVAVRFAEAPTRTTLVLRSLDGTILANGDQIQSVSAGRVTSQVVFNFTDGSVHDETSVFSQNGVFRLLSYHLVQKGPSFRWTLAMTMNTETGRVTVRHRDRGGNEDEIEDATLQLPSDVANGMMVTVLKNLSASARSAAAFVAAIPEPRPVKLAISAGSESLSIAGSSRRVTHYVIKAEIGGLAGLLAPLFGKQPPDTHVWIAEGGTPAFVRSEGPLYYGGPLWRIER